MDQQQKRGCLNLFGFFGGKTTAERRASVQEARGDSRPLSLLADSPRFDDLSKESQPGQASEEEIPRYDDRPVEARTAPTYRLRDDFMTSAEASFFHVLQRVSSNWAMIFPKVRLVDLVYAPKQEQQFVAWQKINRKHVDFVLCDPDTLRPILAIELDDRSHRRPDRIERDAFVDRIFNDAKLPLIRFPARRAYDPRMIADAIAQAVPLSVSKADTSESGTPPADATGLPRTAIALDSAVSSTPDTRRCERCGGTMQLRRAAQGKYAGEEFWGCSNFPHCRNIVPITG